ncbi:hypothetical protein ACFL2Q_06235 [Thermodesulfobacteriota bacterium]
MTDHHKSLDRITGLDLAEIKTLILVKEIGKEELQRVLQSKGVETLEELDSLTAWNFPYYLRSL